MLPLVEPELLLRVSMLPSRCSSARQRRGPGQVTVQSGGGRGTLGQAACPEAPIWSILLQGDPHVLPRWERWQLRSQAQWKREKLPGWQAPVVPSPWACACTCSHTHAQPACLPNFMRGSCPGSTGRTGGEMPGHGKDHTFPA